MFWLPNITTILIAWLLQCVIMMGYVWFKKSRKPEESYDCWLIKGMRGCVFIILTVFAFIFIDTNVKLLIGVAGYGNISLHLASIILTFIISFEIIVGAVFIAPNRKGIITFTIVLVTFIIIGEIYIPIVNSLNLDLLGSSYSAFEYVMMFPILVGTLTASILTLVEFLLKKKTPEREIVDKPFWNIQEKAKKYMGVKFGIVLWALISAELLLNLQGMSLLLWFT